MTKQRNVVVRVLKSFVEMFWVFSIGSQELKENLLLAPERDNKASFDITPHKIAPIKSSAIKQDLEFTKMEATILTSQALCAKISNHMGWIKEKYIFLC
jgi:hypothetical protein